MVVLVEGDLNDDCQAQDVTKGKMRHYDVALETSPNVEGSGGWIHLDVVGDECAFDPHRTEARTSARPSRDVNSRVTPNGTSGRSLESRTSNIWGHLQSPEYWSVRGSVSGIVFRRVGSGMLRRHGIESCRDKSCPVPSELAGVGR